MTGRSPFLRTRKYRVLALFVVIFAALAALLQPKPQQTPEKVTETVISPAQKAPIERRVPVPLDEPIAAWGKGIPTSIAKISGTGGTVTPVVDFTEIADDVFSAQTARYNAVISKEAGLVYRPLAAGDKARLSVKLSKVVRGNDVLFEQGAANEDEILVPEAVGRLSFWRAPGFEEQFHARGDGIEQTFVFEDQPDGKGAITFVCAVDSEGLQAAPARKGRTGGISFLDAKGDVAVRYGRIVVRDSGVGAKQQSVALDPELAADGKALSFAIPGDWLDRAEFPIVVDPLVGTDFLVSPNNPTGIGPPTICAGNNSFLVAWTDYRDGSNLPRMYASIISTSGIVGADFPISSAVGFPRNYASQRIAAAFDGSNWLVVWADDREPGGGIRGALISSIGQVLGGNDFLIASTSGLVSELPLATHNGSDFVVAWHDVPSGVAGGSQIFFSRVTSSATAAPTQGIGSDFSTLNQLLFFLSPQKPSGDTLLVFRENNEAPVQYRSVRIAPDGAVRDPGGTAMFKEDISDGGFGRPIGVNFNQTGWEILSSIDQTFDSSIYLHKQDTSGLVTPPSGIFAEVGLGPTGAALDSFAPAYAGSNEWLFVRNEKVNSTTFHQIGKRVGFDRSDKDPVPFQIDTATQGILHSGVAAQSGNFFLVAWADGRSGTAQPSQLNNIRCALVDTTFSGLTGTALVPVITASPVNGEPPLLVSFDSAGSSVGADSLLWDFGDGTTSTASKVEHTYKNRGTYIASLRLSKGPYSVIESVIIRVGNGGNSTDIPKIGTPIANSPGLVTEVFIQSFACRLDFADVDKDILRIAGTIDRTILPDSLTGVFVSLGIGSNIRPFSLDANGVFKSDVTATPQIVFQVNPKTGQFTYQALNENLRDAMNGLGATNTTVVDSERKIVTVPITITVGSNSVISSVGPKYVAKANVSGTLGYSFLGAGDQVSGSFQIEKFTARENKAENDGFKSHTYNLKGRLSQPGGGKYRPAADGSFVFIFGDNPESLPAGQFLGVNGKLKFKSRSGVKGIRKFQIDFVTGKFMLQADRLTAEGPGGSGLPLANSGENITKVDLALSFRFDLAEFPQLSAGRYVPLERKNASAKGWTLR